MQYNGTESLHYTSLTQLMHRQHYAYLEYLQQALHLFPQKKQIHSDIDCTNHILALIWTKQLGFFRENIIYTHPSWNCWHIREFGRNVLLITLVHKSLQFIIPRKINSFYISIGHLNITIITAFFDVGFFGTIIFGMTFVITDFKLRFQYKILGKGLV